MLGIAEIGRERRCTSLGILRDRTKVAVHHPQHGNLLTELGRLLNDRLLVSRQLIRVGLLEIADLRLRGAAGSAGHRPTWYPFQTPSVHETDVHRPVFHLSLGLATADAARR